MSDSVRKAKNRISLAEFVIRAFACFMGIVPKTAVEWKVKRIKK